jgi:hypothetical protein
MKDSQHRYMQKVINNSRKRFKFDQRKMDADTPASVYDQTKVTLLLNKDSMKQMSSVEVESTNAGRMTAAEKYEGSDRKDMGRQRESRNKLML